jgi:hypothetical protein
MLCYHRTPDPASILTNGFRDGAKPYATDQRRGVWLSDMPLGINEGARGATVLSIEIPDAVFVQYERVEEGKGYREALIPALAVNQYGPPKFHDHEYAGLSRRELVRGADSYEKQAAKMNSVEASKKAKEMRDAIALFDRLGWRHFMK